MMFEGDVERMLYMAMARVTWDDVQIGLYTLIKWMFKHSRVWRIIVAATPPSPTTCKLQSRT